MNLITTGQKEKLEAQWRASAESDGGIDHRPVVKLFTPDAGATWLLTELDPEGGDRAFGLCDLGLGFPEIGYVSLGELASVRGALGLPVERDRWFTPERTVSAYAECARRHQGIRSQCKCGDAI
ncbi:DUF2958 domain-containing protein [Granulosicoccus sp. 3-233]|uniref:DUF2958 domain-containing protein n=1 Tax=Granulosicoccus sp. 3-233 TaxID=3417969 RepID=UPI003D33A5CB